MRTGIITFHAANNYGAVLQAYALQQFINKNYSEVIIIDYRNREMDKAYHLPTMGEMNKNPKNAAFRIMQMILYKNKNKGIERFRARYMKLSKKYDANTIPSANCEADIFITGSDQVWNYMITGCDANYFLNFVSGKTRCSYAASFGISDIPEEYRRFYQKMLDRMDYISVREHMGQKIVNKLTRKESCVVPDPTLLIDQNEWDSLCVAPDVKKPYILVYKITKADKLLTFAKRLAMEKGLDIIYIPNDLKSGIIGKVKLDVGPCEWLGYIREAEYVVTNSFHGAVFSIIFGKKFYAEVSERVNHSTSRLEDLLKTFNLENRKINNIITTNTNEELIHNKENIIRSQKEVAIRFFNEVYREYK